MQRDGQHLAPAANPGRGLTEDSASAAIGNLSGGLNVDKNEPARCEPKGVQCRPASNAFAHRTPDSQVWSLACIARVRFDGGFMSTLRRITSVDDHAHPAEKTRF
jgi:hypothetical protein